MLKLLLGYQVIIGLLLAYYVNKIYKRIQRNTDNFTKWNDTPGASALSLNDELKGKRLKMVIFAFFLGPLRVGYFGSTLLSSIIFSNLMSIGQDINKPMAKWREIPIRLCIRIAASTSVMSFNCKTTVVQQQADYSLYLGPNWKQELATYKKVAPTIVINHSSVLDILTIIGSHW